MGSRRKMPSYRLASRRITGRAAPTHDERAQRDDCHTCGAGVGELCACHQDRRHAS